MPIVYVNHVFENATGYSAAEVLDMHNRTFKAMLEAARRSHIPVLSWAHHIRRLWVATAASCKRRPANSALPVQQRRQSGVPWMAAVPRACAC
jgi:hypothetical protein